jgi:hypothetical protein
MNVPLQAVDCRRRRTRLLDHTEEALTKDLSEDLRDAWERIAETAVEFGEQRIYASHHSIMFARKSCYFFVRPRRSALEVIVFLNRAVRSPQIRKGRPRISLACLPRHPCHPSRPG